MSNAIVMEGINSKGFGFAPKMVMKDQRLSIESKSIYMYFSSYCGAGESSFPKLSTILYDLKISESRYYRHFNPLKDLGYIEVKSRRTQTEDGKWVADSNLYILKQMIDLTITVNISDSKSTVNKKNDDSEHIGNTKSHQLTQNEGTQNEGTQNEGDIINNNSINNNSINSNSMIDDERATEITRRKNLYKQWCEISRVTPPVLKFIKENTMVLSNDLYDLLLEKAITNVSDNKKIYSYFKTSVINCIKDNEFTVDDYNKSRSISDKDYRVNPKANGSSPNNKNKFKNFDQKIDVMSEQEFESHLEASQSAKFGDNETKEESSYDIREKIYIEAVNNNWNIGPHKKTMAINYAKENNLEY